MGTKALKKELFVAIIMVLIATLTLTASTYAWFAANNSVSASSLTVTAETNQPFLQISVTTTSSDFATSATFTSNNAATNVHLTTPLNLSGHLIDYKAAQSALDSSKVTPAAATSPATLLWGTAFSSEVDEVQATNVPWDVTANLNEYALATQVYVRTAANTNGYKLMMDVPSTISNGTNSIPEAFRILAVAADGKWALYDNGLGTVTHCSDGYLVQEIAEEGVGVGYDTIAIYLYFDGTDDVSDTETATDLTAITSNLVFSCSDSL